MTSRRAAGPTDLPQAVLSMLEAAVAAVRDAVESTAGETARCQQTWCPCCAVAAVVAGEPHPLVAVLADHGAALVAALAATSTRGTSGGSPDEAPDAARRPDGPGHYQRIPVTVHD